MVRVTVISLGDLIFLLICSTAGSDLTSFQRVGPGAALTGMNSLMRFLALSTSATRSSDAEYFTLVTS